MLLLSRISPKISPKIYPKIIPVELLGFVGDEEYDTLGSRNNVAISTPTVSRITYPGVTGAISITSGIGHYRKNGGSWVNTAGTLIPTDYIEARITSSASYETAVELVFSIDGSADTFTVTTMAEETTGFPYTFPFELG